MNRHFVRVVPWIALLAGSSIRAELKTPNSSAAATSIVFRATNELAHPSIWTGDNVRVNYGHTPFQRAPNLIQPPVLTNVVATQQTIRINLRQP